MRVRVSCVKIYDVSDLMPEFKEYQDDHPLTLSALQDFIMDRFVHPNFDECDVEMEIVR